MPNSFGPSSVAATQSEGNLFTGTNPNVFGAVDNAANKITQIGGFDSSSAFRLLTDLRDYNNKWSADQARIQREWQEKQNAKAMEFNSSEAAKNRDWQQMMSNTAHQREVADLQAAGLNPVLSAMNGNGAAVTSGATASGVTSSGASGQTDTSLNSALVNLLGSFLDTQTRLQTANINAINNLAVADKQGEINKALTLLRGELDSSLSYQNFLQQKHLSADQHSYNKYLAWLDNELKKDYTFNYPSNVWNTVHADVKKADQLAMRNPNGLFANIFKLFGHNPWKQTSILDR